MKAKELRSDVSTEVEIRSQYGISEEDMARMLMNSIQNAQNDRNQRALIEARNEANNVLVHSKKFMEQNKEIISAEEMVHLAELVAELTQEIEKGTKDSIELTLEKLNSYSRPIAQRAMDYNIANALKGSQL